MPDHKRKNEETDWRAIAEETGATDEDLEEIKKRWERKPPTADELMEKIGIKNEKKPHE